MPCASRARALKYVFAANWYIYVYVYIYVYISRISDWAKNSLYPLLYLCLAELAQFWINFGIFKWPRKKFKLHTVVLFQLLTHDYGLLPSSSLLTSLHWPYLHHYFLKITIITMIVIVTHCFTLIILIITQLLKILQSLYYLHIFTIFYLQTRTSEIVVD